MLFGARPKSEISLGNIGLGASGGEAQNPKIRHVPRKCSTLRLWEERPRNRDFPWGMWRFARLWGGLLEKPKFRDFHTQSRVARATRVEKFEARNLAAATLNMRSVDATVAFCP